MNSKGYGREIQDVRFPVSIEPHGVHFRHFMAAQDGTLEDQAKRLKNQATGQVMQIRTGSVAISLDRLDAEHGSL
jgi:hypothetical protein